LTINYYLFWETVAGCWTVGLLDCWTVGLLDYWIVGLLDCWTVDYFLFFNLGDSCRLLDCWIVGLLDGWMVGLLDGWTVGLLDCWTVALEFIKILIFNILFFQYFFSAFYS
jgi:hypothetical protein